MNKINDINEIINKNSILEVNLHKINQLINQDRGIELNHFVKEIHNADPALASGVILTTITDVFGFLSFLGIAPILFI